MTSSRAWTFGIGRIIGVVAVLAALVALPFHIDDYLLHWAVIVLMYVSISLAWDVLARTGQSSFGQAGFFGLGAYASSIISTSWHLHPLVAIAISTLGVGVVASLCAKLFLRVRGIYFAILTLSVAEVFKVLATELKDLTGGPMGLTVPPLFKGNVVQSYFFVLIAAVVCVLAINWLQRSKLNFGITAIRSSPEVAAAFGVPINPIRVGVFAASAMVTGVMGGFYAFYTSYLNPESVFDTGISVAPVIMCIFGGLYTIVGPIIGAVLLTILQEGLRTVIESGSLVVYGLLLVASILFMPQGVWPLIRRNWSRAFVSSSKDVAYKSTVVSHAPGK
jgi:branched-chain amino acid transport system permease protein